MPSGPWQSPTLLVCGALLCAALGVAAQTPPATQQVPAADDRLLNFHDQLRLRQQQLRESLADPRQRTALREGRIQQARAKHPELARVLQLESAVEERLFNLLADHQLAIELQPGMQSFDPNEPVPKVNPLSIAAAEHTQHMREIGAIVGAQKLDAYVDYIATVQDRQQVERLDAALPAAAKLSFEQKDALVALLYQDGVRRGEEVSLAHPFQLTPSPGDTPAERRRRAALQMAAMNEASKLSWESYLLELVEKTRSILTPEQVKVFAAQQQAAVDSSRAVREQERRRLGLTLDAPLPQPEPAPMLTGNVQLTVDLEVNATRVIQKIRSGRGAIIWFDGPEGLRIRAHAALVDRDVLELELRFYEIRNKTRWLVGFSSMTAQLTRAGAPTSQSGHTSTALQGRKGYALGWTYSATYE